MQADRTVAGKHHRPEDHQRTCYCGRPATVHVMYGSGCANVCGIHKNVIKRRKGTCQWSAPLFVDEPEPGAPDWDSLDQGGPCF